MKNQLTFFKTRKAQIVGTTKSWWKKWKSPFAAMLTLGALVGLGYFAYQGKDMISSHRRAPVAASESASSYRSLPSTSYSSPTSNSNNAWGSLSSLADKTTKTLFPSSSKKHSHKKMTHGKKGKKKFAKGKKHRKHKYASGHHKKKHKLAKKHGKGKKHYAGKKKKKKGHHLAKNGR